MCVPVGSTSTGVVEPASSRNSAAVASADVAERVEVERVVEDDEAAIDRRRRCR